MFVGAVADNFDERIEQKIFHCEIVVDNEKVKAETARYKKIPQIAYSGGYPFSISGDIRSVPS